MRVTINGEAVVITSDLKVSDIKEIKKLRPEALKLKGGENGKEEIFAISVAREGSGSLCEYGAEFATIGRGDGDRATITLTAPGITDIKTWFYDNYGIAYNYLRQLEERLPAVAEEIAANRAEIFDSIQVAD